MSHHQQIPHRYHHLRRPHLQTTNNNNSYYIRIIHFFLLVILLCHSHLHFQNVSALLPPECSSEGNYSWGSSCQYTDCTQFGPGTELLVLLSFEKAAQGINALEPTETLFGLETNDFVTFHEGEGMHGSTAAEFTHGAAINSTALHPGTDSFSACFWTKDIAPELVVLDTLSSGNGYAIGLTEEEFYFDLTSRSYRFSALLPSSFSFADEHLFCVTAGRSTNITFYVDNTTIGSSTPSSWSSSLTTSLSPRIATNSDTNTTMSQGKLDEIMFFRGVLRPSQIGALYHGLCRRYDHSCSLVPALNETVCSGHGSCDTLNNCICHGNKKYGGSNCEFPYCQDIISTDSAVCAGRGTCVRFGWCECDEPDKYGLAGCTGHVCFGDTPQFNDTLTFGCSSHGYCMAPDVCECAPGYLAPDCSVTLCYGILSNDTEVCSGHGLCNSKDNCFCDLGWDSSSNCSTYAPFQCGAYWMNDSRACSGHGTCSGTDVCECDDGYTTEGGDGTECFSCPAGVSCNMGIIPCHEEFATIFALPEGYKLYSLENDSNCHLCDVFDYCNDGYLLGSCANSLPEQDHVITVRDPHDIGSIFTINRNLSADYFPCPIRDYSFNSSDVDFSISPNGTVSVNVTQFLKGAPVKEYWELHLIIEFDNGNHTENYRFIPVKDLTTQAAVIGSTDRTVRVGDTLTFDATPSTLLVAGILPSTSMRAEISESYTWRCNDFNTGSCLGGSGKIWTVEASVYGVSAKIITLEYRAEWKGVVSSSSVHLLVEILPSIETDTGDSEGEGDSSHTHDDSTGVDHILELVRNHTSGYHTGTTYPLSDVLTLFDSISSSYYQIHVNASTNTTSHSVHTGEVLISEYLNILLNDTLYRSAVNSSIGHVNSTSHIVDCELQDRIFMILEEISLMRDWMSLNASQLILQRLQGLDLFSLCDPVSLNRTLTLVEGIFTYASGDVQSMSIQEASDAKSLVVDWLQYSMEQLLLFSSTTQNQSRSVARFSSSKQGVNAGWHLSGDVVFFELDCLRNFSRIFASSDLLSHTKWTVIIPQSDFSSEDKLSLHHQHNYNQQYSFPLSGHFEASVKDDYTCSALSQNHSEWISLHELCEFEWISPTEAVCACSSFPLEAQQIMGIMQLRIAPSPHLEEPGDDPSASHSVLPTVLLSVGLPFLCCFGCLLVLCCIVIAGCSSTCFCCLFSKRKDKSNLNRLTVSSSTMHETFNSSESSSVAETPRRRLPKIVPSQQQQHFDGVGFPGSASSSSSSGFYGSHSQDMTPTWAWKLRQGGS